VPPENNHRRDAPGLRVALVAALLSSNCGSSPITADRIERAVEQTFANLVEVQVARLRIPPVDVAQLEVTASCRTRAAARDTGAGEWTCRLRWLGPDRQPLRDTFDVVVTTDGCYTATAEGDQLGGPTLKATDGRDVRNLLYVFEGCFDTT
jgi:hypothetical protein